MIGMRNQKKGVEIERRRRTGADLRKGDRKASLAKRRFGGLPAGASNDEPLSGTAVAAQALNAVDVIHSSTSRSASDLMVALRSLCQDPAVHGGRFCSHLSLCQVSHATRLLLL